ncbi:MAG: hypothetical protein V5A44_05590 [Haloarculaceae archaeon]
MADGGEELGGRDLSGTSLGDATLEEGGRANADDSRSSLVGSVVTGAVITVGVALLGAGWSEFWVVFVVGLVAVLPASVKLAGENPSRSRRYASRNSRLPTVAALRSGFSLAPAVAHSESRNSRTFSTFQA